MAVRRQMVKLVVIVLCHRLYSCAAVIVLLLFVFVLLLFVLFYVLKFVRNTTLPPCVNPIAVVQIYIYTHTHTHKSAAILPDLRLISLRSCS